MYLEAHAPKLLVVVLLQRGYLPLRALEFHPYRYSWVCEQEAVRPPASVLYFEQLVTTLLSKVLAALLNLDF